MTFEDTKLPKHPTIEKAYAELTRLDAEDKYTTRGILIASIIAKESKSQDPDAIAAGLLVPLASDAGARLLAQAELPPRVTQIIDAVFELGGLTMRGEPLDVFYMKQDAGTRAVILASSARMFEVMEGEMKASPLAADAEYLNGTLAPLKKFTAMLCRAEAEETGLARKCEDAVKRIDDLVNGPAPPPEKPKPAHPQP